MYKLWTTPWALFLHKRMIEDANRPSTTWAKLWSELNLDTTPSRRSVLPLSSLSKRHDIIWLVKLFMSFWELIPCVFSWRNRGLWILDWLIGPFSCPNTTWLLSPKKRSQRSSPRRFSGCPPSSGNFEITHEHSGWVYRSLYNLRRWCMTDVLWWCIKNRPYM